MIKCNDLNQTRIQFYNLMAYFKNIDNNTISIMIEFENRESYTLFYKSEEDANIDLTQLDNLYLPKVYIPTNSNSIMIDYNNLYSGTVLTNAKV